MKKKEQEEFEGEEQESSVKKEESAASKLQSFILDNKILVITGSLIVIAMVALYIYFDTSRQASSMEASLALSRIFPYYEQGNYELALNGDPSIKVRGEDILGLKEIVVKYENTSQGRVAALYAANAYMELEKIEESKSYFEIALKSDSDLIKSGANAGLGLYFESKDDLKEAASYYEEASKLSGESSGKFRYLYYSALCYEKSGDNTKAEELYREIIGNNQFSEFLGLAKAGLTRLGTIIE
jgi:tetratricopeptide (TPR) repeat protein